MTSARNRLLPLSGNRRLFLSIVAILAGACSPKVRPVHAVVNKPLPQKNNVAVVTSPTATAKPTITQHVFSLLLPFGLDNLNPGAKYSAADLKKAGIALEYYRGFKLALDSLTARGYNYKLQLFDTNDDPAQAHTLAYNPKIRASDLIVGPVFPQSLKAFTDVLTSARKPILSPLAPTPPENYKNQNLITINPPLACHAWAAAAYINDKLKPKKIFLLRSGYSDENSYIIPFKKAIDSLSKKHIKVVSLTVIRGQLKPLLAQLSASAQNIFVVPATDQAFLMVTLHSLDTLSRKYPVTVFGHPRWGKFTFLKAEQLQRINTCIISAYNINYKDAPAIRFIHSYRSIYHEEPGEYAIKGFDEGLYFGQEAAQNDTYWKTIDQHDFTGLHNTFHFEKKPGLGWVNTHVFVMRYANYQLKPAE